MRLSRRQFGQLLAAGTLTAPVPGVSNSDDASRLYRAPGQEDVRVDAEVLGYFTRTLSEYYRADKMLGPCRLIGTVLAQIDVLDSLRRNVTPAQAEPLLRVLSHYGEMCGWLFQDSEDVDAAASWSRQAAEWAQCAGDWNMAAYMLVRQANIAVLSDDHVAVVQLAGAARRANTAISILEHSVAWTASTLARDRGHLLAKLAVAVTQSSHPDPDGAATPRHRGPGHRQDDRIGPQHALAAHPRCRAGRAVAQPCRNPQPARSARRVNQALPTHAGNLRFCVSECS
jgi:hypothetical protein